MLERSTVGTKPDPDDGGGDLDDFDRPRIRTVISSTSGGGGGAAGGSGGVGGRGGPKRRGGQDQDDDEFDYEEDFQDDEEGIAKIDDLADEEETRELEVRRLPRLGSLPLSSGSDLLTMAFSVCRTCVTGTYPSRDARR